jgi:hypothetical protein
MRRSMDEQRYVGVKQQQQESPEQDYCSFAGT